MQVSQTSTHPARPLQRKWHCLKHVNLSMVGFVHWSIHRMPVRKEKEPWEKQSSTALRMSGFAKKFWVVSNHAKAVALSKHAPPPSLKKCNVQTRSDQAGKYSTGEPHMLAKKVPELSATLPTPCFKQVPSSWQNLCSIQTKNPLCRVPSMPFHDSWCPLWSTGGNQLSLPWADPKLHRCSRSWLFHIAKHDNTLCTSMAVTCSYLLTQHDTLIPLHIPGEDGSLNANKE